MTERLAYRPEEVAEALGVSRSYCYDLIARGELAASRLGRLILVEREAVDQLLASHRVRPGEAETLTVRLLEEAMT